MTIGETVRKAIKELSDGLLGLMMPKDFRLTDDEVSDDLKYGVTKVILSTNAIKKPKMVKKLCDEIGTKHVIISIDAENGFVSINGWTEKTKISSINLITQMVGLGINQFIYTDITKDGTLSEPNYNKIKELINNEYSISIAGGITHIAHLEKLKNIGVDGAIIGKAIYTGNINLHEALKI